MARINERLVVQLVDRVPVGDSTIVFVDDSTGFEYQVPIADVPRLVQMLAYLYAHSGVEGAI